MLFACGGRQQLLGLDAPTLAPDAASNDSGTDAGTTCLGSGNLRMCVPLDVPDAGRGLIYMGSN